MEIKDLFTENPVVANYAVAFLDLLGQRSMYENEGLVPSEKVELEALRKKVHETIGAVAQVRIISNTFLNANRQRVALLDAPMTKEERDLFEKIRREDVRQQHWSDGTVIYTPFASGAVEAPAIGILSVLGLCGLQCLLGLANERPIRGGVEVGWAVEAFPGELHGCAIVRAYELESVVAGYARIVVGPNLIDYLNNCTEEIVEGPADAVNRALAESCLKMLAEDEDKNWVVDYCSDHFKSLTSGTLRPEFFEKAKVFVESSLCKWKSLGDEKLKLRYEWLQRFLSR